MRLHRTRTPLPLLAALLALTAARASAQYQSTVTSGIAISKTGQSVWGPGTTGPSATLTRGWGWRASGSFDRLDDALGTGIEGTYFTSGSVGLSVHATLTGGDLAASVNATQRLQRSSPSATIWGGQKMVIGSSWSNATTSMSTGGPTLDAGVNVAGSFTGMLNARGCIVGACLSGSTLVLVPQTDQEVVGYDSGTGDIRVFGEPSPLSFPFGEEITLPQVPGTSVTLYNPDLAIDQVTGSTSATGSVTSDVFTLHVDPVAFIAQAVLGDIPCLTGCFLSVGGERMGYKQFSGEFAPTLSLRQQIEVLARPFTSFSFNREVRYRVGGGAWATGSKFQLAGWNPSFQLEPPEGLGGDQLVMTTELRAEARVTNRTYLLVDPRVQFKVLELDLPGTAADIGPLYEKTWNLAQPAALELYSNVFDIVLGTAVGATMTMNYAEPMSGGAPGSSGPGDPLGGGDDYVEPPPPPPPSDLQLVPADGFETTATPEPATLALLATGLLALAVAARRRRA